MIDLFTALNEVLPPHRAESEEAGDEAVEAAFSSINFESFIADTDVSAVRILRAGRNNDGLYSQRVTKFDWEGLFRRAPSVYRAFAERLGEMFRYVLIDSRTGVTDISGICTSLLPEKLVVVFTPNRQSLSGVRETVERATAYRRNSDDLRPLLVYPLPSRIEVSLEDLRTLWRLGSRDHLIVGYQPMFEELLARAYGLRRCALSAYFDVVQIQQTPDYAYGEEIAVRRSSDRFSLANSYRVFADRLVSGDPPWTREEAEQPVVTGAAAAPDFLQSSPEAEARERGLTTLKSEESKAVQEGERQKVFLSYARENYEPVVLIAKVLESHGFDVWWNRDIPAGIEYDRMIADALDGSDVAVVCWSKASIASEAVLAEAREGLRRGVLMPVLLDDVVPPLGFRSIQSVDLRRDIDRGLKQLVDAVTRIARNSPGTDIAASLQEVREVPPLTTSVEKGHRAPLLVLVLFLAVALICAAMFWRNSSIHPIIGRPEVRVPNFVGSNTSDVRKAAAFLGLDIVFTDQQGIQSPSLEGVVVGQSPAADQLVWESALVKLQVEAATAVVPLIVGMTLDGAVAALSSVKLRLGAAESAPAIEVTPGTIIKQSPEAGIRTAEGSQVNVTFAAPPSSRPSPASIPQDSRAGK